MKNKVLKAMACFMSVCMLSMSLAGCGDDSSDNTPGSSNPGSSTPTSEQPSGGADDASQPDEQTPDIGADQSDGLFPAYDFGGVELKVLAYNDLGNLNPDAENLNPSDDDDAAAAADKATKKQDRQDKKDYIEAKYNVKLTFVELPTNDWAEIPNQLVMNYTSGHPDADIMDIYFQHIVTLLSNNMIYDLTNDMDNRIITNKLFKWNGMTYGVGSYIAGEGLYYNKTMIKNLGMEYTPAEMFAMGQWDYDSCFNYLQELQSLMTDPDDYPLHVAPYYWTIFAPSANGGESLLSNGDLRYLSDTGLETEEFLLKLIDNGLCAVPAVYDEEGNLQGYNNWGYPGDTFDKGEHVAMAHRAAWQVAGLDQSVFELGFVPYPWGSGTTLDESKIGQMDCYTTIDKYIQACFDGQTVCLTNGIQSKADPMQVLSMVLEWMGWKFAMSDYVEPEGSSKGASWLEDGIDQDLYIWSMDRTIADTWYMFANSDIISWIPSGAVYYRGESLRAAYESAYNVDMQLLIKGGYTTEDAWSADFDMIVIEDEEEEE